MFHYFKRLPHCLHFQKSNRIPLEKLSSGLARVNRRSCSWRPHRSPVLWWKPPWRPNLLIPPPCTLWSWRSGPPRCPPPLLQHWPAGSHPSGDPRLLLFHTKLSIYAGQGKDFELTAVQMFVFLVSRWKLFVVASMEKFLMFTGISLAGQDRTSGTFPVCLIPHLSALNISKSLADSNFNSVHLSHPGMPMVPRARDNGTSSGQFGRMWIRPVPLQTTWVLQPQWATTWVPTGNVLFLLWITLQKQKQIEKQLSAVHSCLTLNFFSIKFIWDDRSGRWFLAFLETSQNSNLF